MGDEVWVSSASGIIKMHDVHAWERGRSMVVGKECLVSRLLINHASGMEGYGGVRGCRLAREIAVHGF